MNEPAGCAIKGAEHWTSKDGGVKLFLFEKCAGDPAKSVGTICSCTAPRWPRSRPSTCRCRAADSSAMDHFAKLGYDVCASTWKATAARQGPRQQRADQPGADDCYAAALYIQSCGASGRSWSTDFLRRFARGAVCRTPPRDGGAAGARRHGWTGEGSPTLEQRRKKLPEFIAKNRRPMDKAFIHSVFDRDHPTPPSAR